MFVERHEALIGLDLLRTQHAVRLDHSKLRAPPDSLGCRT
jgi:hypothetical protein